MIIFLSCLCHIPFLDSEPPIQKHICYFISQRNKENEIPYWTRAQWFAFYGVKHCPCRKDRASWAGSYELLSKEQCHALANLQYCKTFPRYGQIFPKDTGAPLFLPLGPHRQGNGCSLLKHLCHWLSSRLCHCFTKSCFCVWFCVHYSISFWEKYELQKVPGRDLASWIKWEKLIIQHFLVSKSRPTSGHVPIGFSGNH